MYCAFYLVVAGLFLICMTKEAKGALPRSFVRGVYEDLTDARRDHQ
jgi:hypothetical protein